MPIPKEPGELRELMRAAMLAEIDDLRKQPRTKDYSEIMADAAMRALAEYDPTYAKATELGEPTFTLRAQDDTAYRYVDDWTSDHSHRISATKFDEARRCANAMRNWPANKRKLPD